MTRTPVSFLDGTCNDASLRSFYAGEHCSRSNAVDVQFPCFDYNDSSSIQHSLAQDGLVFMDGIGSEAEALSVASAIGEVYPHHDSDALGITHIRAYETASDAKNLQGFSSQELSPHTDRSSALDPPDYIFMIAVKQPEQGGESVLADGKRIYDLLRKNDPVLLRHLLEPQSAAFSDGREVHMDSVFHMYPSGDVHLRFRADNLGYFSTPICSRISSLFAAIEACTFKVKLRPRQAVLCSNRRWLHGRTMFTGEREIWRILVRRSDSPHPIGFASEQEETQGLIKAA